MRARIAKQLNTSVILAYEGGRVSDRTKEREGGGNDDDDDGSRCGGKFARAQREISSASASGPCHKEQQRKTTTVIHPSSQLRDSDRSLQGQLVFASLLFNLVFL